MRKSRRLSHRVGKVLNRDPKLWLSELLVNSKFVGNSVGELEGVMS
jgi:hypothetical protein